MKAKKATSVLFFLLPPDGLPPLNTQQSILIQTQLKFQESTKPQAKHSLLSTSSSQEAQSAAMWQGLKDRNFSSTFDVC